MSELDRKIEDKKLQLGSLNDELKDTVASIEANHKIRDGLLEEIGELETRKSESGKALERVKKEHLKELTLHLEQVKGADSNVRVKIKEVEKIVGFMLDLESKKEGLMRTIKNLKKQENDLKKETAKLSKEKVKLKEISTKLDKFENKLKEISAESDVASVELKDKKNVLSALIEQISREKIEFSAYKEREQEKIRQGLISIEGIKKDFERKDKDRRIVVARLKKLWKLKFSEPFPNI